MVVSYQTIELVWMIFIFIAFSGQSHMDTIWIQYYSFGPDSFVELGINTHIWSPYHLHGKFLDLFELLRVTLLGTHSLWMGL